VGRLSENSEAAFYDIETCRLIWSLEVQVSARLHWMIIVIERKRKELINYSRNSLPIILRRERQWLLFILLVLETLESV